MNNKNNLTQRRLKEMVIYDIYTGEFINKKKRGRIPEGKVLGYPNNNGYLLITLDNCTYLAHRLAVLYVTGKWPTGVLDHINRDRKDNRWCNIRLCSKEENNRNRSLSRNNTSGATGVVFEKRVGIWQARIDVNGNRILLGRFKEFELAELVASEARAKYHGDFAP